jgi:hypothetical protein
MPAFTDRARVSCHGSMRFRTVPWRPCAKTPRSSISCTFARLQTIISPRMPQTDYEERDIVLQRLRSMSSMLIRTLRGNDIPRQLVLHTIPKPLIWIELQILVFWNVSSTSPAVQVLNGRYQCEAALYNVRESSDSTFTIIIWLALHNNHYPIIESFSISLLHRTARHTVATSLVPPISSA